MQVTDSKTIRLLSWTAWAPGLGLSDDDILKAPSLPANLRRRTTPLSKLAIELSHRAIGEHEMPDYSIFCSEHGELNCTIQLLKELCENVPLSPTRFSQSVHNTAAGLFSMIHHIQNNMTALGAETETFSMGCIEAYAYLATHPNQTVLLTMYDEPVPHEYDSLNIKSNFHYGVSLLLTNKNIDATALTLTLTEQPTASNHEPQALKFIAWLQASTKNSLQQHICRWEKIA